MLKVRTSHIKDKSLRSCFTPRVDQDTKFSTQLFYISEEDLPEVGDRVSLGIQIEKGKEQQVLKWLQYYVSKAFDLGGLVRPWNTQHYGPDNLLPELTHPDHKIPIKAVKLFHEGPLSDLEYFLVPVSIEALYGIRKDFSCGGKTSNSFSELVLGSTEESDLYGKIEGDSFIRGTGGVIANLPDIKGYRLGKLLVGPIALESKYNSKPQINLAVAVPVLPEDPNNPTDLSLSYTSTPYLNPNKENGWLAAAADVRSYLTVSKIYTQSYPGLVPVAEEHNNALQKVLDRAPEVDGKKQVQIVIPINTRKVTLNCKTIDRNCTQASPNASSVEYIVSPSEFEAVMDFAAPIAFLEGSTGAHGFRNPISGALYSLGDIALNTRSIRDQSINSLFEPGGEVSLISSADVTVGGKTVKSICSLCPRRNDCALADFSTHNLGCLKTLNIYKDTLANIKAKSEPKNAK